MNEFRDLSMRNDEVLMMMSTALKELAVNYHIFMMTATQTNGEWSKHNVRNQNCVAGAKSILNKADAGFVGIKLDMHKEEFYSTLLEDRFISFLIRQIKISAKDGNMEEILKIAKKLPAGMLQGSSALE